MVSSVDCCYGWRWYRELIVVRVEGEYLGAVATDQ